MLRPYNLLSNNLSAGMLCPYKKLWFTQKKIAVRNPVSESLCPGAPELLYSSAPEHKSPPHPTPSKKALRFVKKSAHYLD
jgi:hypothetical protein